MIVGYADNSKTNNIQDLINTKLIYPLFDVVAQREGIEGLVLLGGAARRSAKNPNGFGDKFSDVDIAIFISKLQPWLPNFEYYVPDNIGADIQNGWFEINCHQMLIPRESEPRYWTDDQKKQAYGESIVFYDPHGVTNDLISGMCSVDKSYNQKRIGILLNALNSYQINSDPVKSHLALNKILNQVVELAFKVNGEFRTHKKWRYEALLRLNNLPEYAEQLFSESLLVKKFTKDDVNRRKMAIDKIIGHYSYFPELKYEKTINSEYSIEKRKDMLSLIIGQFYWLVERNPERQMYRGFALNAHDLLNESVSMALESWRISKGEQIRQEVQALGVMNPHPTYQEKLYDLWDESILFRDLLIDSLLVPDMSNQGILNRVKVLKRFITPYVAKLHDTGFIPKDPYHHAINKGIYSDRQLSEEPFGEKVCPLNASEEERKLFTGFCSLHFVGSEDNLTYHLLNPIPNIYAGKQLEILKKMARNIK
jgi:hypothetical protein